MTVFRSIGQDDPMGGSTHTSSSFLPTPPIPPSAPIAPIPACLWTALGHLFALYREDTNPACRPTERWLDAPRGR